MLRLLLANLDPPAGRLGAAIELAQRPRARMSRRIETGLGWILTPVRRRSLRMHWHNGGTGGFRSFVGLVRETQTAVVVLANTNRSVDLLGLRLLEALNVAGGD
jgi:serine-type D-Ala-D-Ala carboxypeptidase/endopeptidase